MIGSPNPRGQFTGYFTKQAQPDFKGTLKDGQAIVFDAKCTSTDKINVSALSAEQEKDLLLHCKLGAWAGVILCYSFKTFVMMPILTFTAAGEHNGHKWWTADEAKEKGYPVKFTGTMIDFLEIPM